MEDNYLESIQKQFLYYKMLGEKTIDQLSEADLFWQYNPESNSIAIIIQHLSGNMKSRWTDFLTADGEKEWRDREKEFEVPEVPEVTKEGLLKIWEAGWACLFEALNSVNKDNFQTEIYIRNMGHTIIEAFNRQLTHYT
jgi:hypothetical protein